ncbi:MAG: HlyD family efflux transporter periplasmic adaptor subunit [Fuerstiella sp.]|nr:HlyD family efflux transporter periplasmic adaptor subunit [Fuerstiella sp.]
MKTFEPQVQKRALQASHRRGSSGTTAIGLLLLFGLIGGGAFVWATLGGSIANDGENGILLYTVARDDILVTVNEDGNVESADNIDVKCSISGGSTILWIIEDGTTVKAGDEIVRLDTSNIEDQLNSQKITFENANATKIQTAEDHEAAILAVNEYREGTFVEELKQAEADIRIAQENLRSAESLLVFTKKMVRKGFATSLQREADQFAVERTTLDLEAAETRRKVLVEFTKEKTLKDLEAKREAAAAQARANQAAFDLEKARLERLRKQFENCVIQAPQNGMVVYANNTGRSRFRGNQDVQIEEGATIRERQTIIRLPDLSRMQVRVTVHESKIDQLQSGMPARIVIQDVEYRGHVVSVASQPEPTSFFSANVKEYATIVAIEGESMTLRPGMTAHVEILVANLKDVLTVPVSSVVEQRESYFCWVNKDDGIHKQELELGRTNDKIVEVLEGVDEGDQVLRNPRTVIDEAVREAPQGDSERDRSQFGSENTPDETGEPRSGSEGPAATRTENSTSRSTSGGQSTLPETGREYIAQYDKDGDGKVAQSELDEQSQRSAQFWFSHVDSDGDGALNETETDTMLESRRRFAGGGAGRPPGTQPADRDGTSDRGRPGNAGGGFDLMQYDSNGDGQVSKEEAPERMRSFFDRMDTDGDGGITNKEIEELRQQRGR